ncbi:Basigin [Lucilia cuprina]|nr:Basigin [Lucilia cuprina]
MEAKFLAGIFSFLSIFLAIYAQSTGADFLVPNYDNVEHQLKAFEIRTPLVLSCNVTDSSVTDITWEKNGTDVRKVKELEGRYRIIAAERKFIIDRTDINDDGVYSCVANNQKKDINVYAKIAVRVPSNMGVVEGEKLTIICTVVGTDPKLSWTFRNLTINSTSQHYSLKADENHVENAILIIENVSMDDRGEYKCIGRNAATDYLKIAEASDASYVRVKGKFAALWPFLGICAEVLILCTIILIYEKRRNKGELDESDIDNQDIVNLEKHNKTSQILTSTHHKIKTKTKKKRKKLLSFFFLVQKYINLHRVNYLPYLHTQYKKKQKQL